MQCRCECHFDNNKIVKKHPCGICKKWHNDSLLEYDTRNRIDDVEVHNIFHAGAFVKGCFMCDLEQKKERVEKKYCKDHGGFLDNKEQCPTCRWMRKNYTPIYCEFGCGVIGHYNHNMGLTEGEPPEEHYKTCEPRKKYCQHHGGLSNNNEQCPACEW